MADVKPREVPAKQAEKFLEGVEDDPKFQRFQNRMALSTRASVIASSRADVVKLQVNAALLTKTVKRRIKFVLLTGAVLLAVDASLRLWWVFAAGALLAVAVFGFLYWMLTKTELVRDELDSRAHDLDEMLSAVCASIEDIDREAASSIRIIDPDTFGAPPAPIKPRAEEA